MDDSQERGAGTPKERKFVSEQDLLETLNRCLWEVERRRAQEATEHQ